MIRVLAVTLVALLGCAPTTQLPPLAQITCVTDVECPPNYACASGGVCVEDAKVDRVLPKLDRAPEVAPSPAKKGDRVTITLVSTKVLASPPVVTLRLLDDEAPPAVPCAAASDRTYTCTHEVTGTENGGLGGSVPFDVALRDTAQNLTTERAAGRLVLDFVAPEVATRIVAPAALREGMELTVFLTLTEEPDGPVQASTTPPLSGTVDGAMTLERVPGTLNWRASHVISADDPEGSVSLSTHVSDRAGNPSGEISLGAITIDRTPLIVTETPAFPAFRRPGQDVDVAFSLNKVTGDGGFVRVSLGLAELTPDAAVQPPRWRFTGHLAEDAADGARPLVLEARDAAGHVLVEPIGTVDVDGTPPAIVPETAAMSLIPPPASLLGEVRALGVGARLSLRFSVSERLEGERPVSVIAHGPGPLALSPRVLAATAFEYEATVTSAVLEGAYDLSVELRDLAGNEATVSVPDTVPVTVDRTAPNAPDVATPERIRFTRAPWGTAAAAQPRFTLRGAAQAVDPLVTVVSFDRTDPATRTELGRTKALVSGAFEELSAGRVDRQDVSVVAVDDAGNASAGVTVRDTEWIATLRGKVPGSRIENPHSLSATRVVEGGSVLGAQEAFEPEGVELAKAAGGDTEALVVDGAAIWRNRAVVNLTKRGAGTCAFDSSRGRVVLYGGRVRESDARDVYEWNGEQWSRSLAASTGPASLHDLSSAFDPIRGRVVLFGGSDNIGGRNADLWEWDGAAWTLRSVVGTPGPRTGHIVVYDPDRRVLVLFGGYIGANAGDAQTWEFDGTTWRQAQVNGPAGRVLANAVWDAVRHKVLLFGGSLNNVQRNDLWEWDGKAWVERTLASGNPPVRVGASMTFDSRRGVAVLFGGANAGGILRDTWEWNGTTWTERSLGPNVPPARLSASLCFDAIRGESVLAGGTLDTTILSAMDDTWVYDGVGWKQRGPSAAGPGPGADGAAVFDAASQRVLFHDGSYAGQVRDDLRAWDGYRWTGPIVSTPRPAARADHGLVYDADRQRLVLFGGDAYTSLRNDLWEWSSAGWTERILTTKPTARAAMTFAYDAARKVSVLFGGIDSNLDLLGDTWEFNGTAWTSRTTSGAPTARAFSASVFDAARGVTVVYGGSTLAADVGDTWEWNGTAWSQREATGPGPRANHTLTYDSDRGRTVLLCGESTGAARSDAWEYDGQSWRLLQLRSSPPPGRSYHLAAYDPARRTTVLYGGSIGSSVDDLWELHNDASMRPGAFVTYDVAASGLPVSTLTGVTARAFAGGRGSTIRLPGRGIDVPGASVSVWDVARGTWVERAANTAPAITPAITEFTTGAADRVTDVIDPSGQLHLLVQPVSGQGNGDPARLAVDAMELVARFRR